ncbi:MAG: ATP-grasp domain-containing protein [Blastococcus sp.]
MPLSAARRHVVVLNRWVGDTAAYADYLDHEALAVSYVVGPLATVAVPATAADLVVLPRIGQVLDDDDAHAIRAAITHLVQRHGPVTRLVALHESDLEVAAALREELDIHGERPASIAPFRDKLLMARTLAALGVPTPVTVALDGPEAVRALPGDTRRPVVVKPRRGSGSSGVRVLHGGVLPPDVPLDGSMIAQPFVAAEILHVDGFFDGVRLGLWSASRYVGTCLEFEAHTVLGSVEIDDRTLAARVEALTTSALRALSPGRPRVFHAELFDGGPDGLSVLEIGGRVGGAEIPQLWREVHGVDLVAVASALQTGAPVPARVTEPQWLGGLPGHGLGGWLLVPPDAERPCVVVDSRPGDGAYWRSLPPLGRVVPRAHGYERSAARFRFRGRSSAEVAARLDAELRSLRFACRPQPDRDILLLGAGARLYREYGLPSVAARGRITLRDRVWPTWQAGYVGGFELLPGSGPLPAATPPAAVLTWDETLVEEAAALAERLGLPGAGVGAARNCRDKLRTREVLAGAGAHAVRFRHVRDVAAARAAADELGYPVVLKPRTLAGSAGVVLAAGPDDVPAAFAQSAGATYPELADAAGILVEEYLDGPEISVDSAVRDGVSTVVNVARKILGPPPCFEEVGHRVVPWRREPWAGPVQELIGEVHRLLDVGTGVTHAEVRLTARGPRLVELNCRLGGDFIPLLGQLATGIDLVGVATDLALGLEPDLAARRDGAAAVEFVYPDEDCVVSAVDVTAARALPHVERAVALAAPGTPLLLPPRGIVPRVAAVVVRAATEQECAVALARARAALRIEVEPLQVAA